MNLDVLKQQICNDVLSSKKYPDRGIEYIPIVPISNLILHSFNMSFLQWSAFPWELQVGPLSG